MKTRMPTQLSADLLKFAKSAQHLDTPKAVLDALDAITWTDCHAHVLGAALLPLSFGASIGFRSRGALRRSRNRHQPCCADNAARNAALDLL